jgi:hypothetical protein
MTRGRGAKAAGATGRRHRPLPPARLSLHWVWIGVMHCSPAYPQALVTAIRRVFLEGVAARQHLRTRSTTA